MYNNEISECIESAWTLWHAVSAWCMVAVAFFIVIIIAVSVCPWFSFSGVCYFYCSFIILCIPCLIGHFLTLGLALIQIICDLKKGIKEHEFLACGGQGGEEPTVIPGWGQNRANRRKGSSVYRICLP